MLLNFLDASLTPTVKCSVTAEDDYNETNLIAEPHSRAYASGFMAYSVIKPPVELLFTLVCPIELQSVVLMTRLGSLKSNGFEVWVKVVRQHASGEDEFRKIGQVYDVLEDGVVFYNTFTADKYQGEIESQSGQLKKCPLFRNLGFREVVSQVRIVIRSTTDRCVPVMKRVQIFGVPARSVSAEEKRLIMTKWERRHGLPRTVDSTIIDTTPHDARADHTKTLNGITIPDEYLDCITFDIMSLPMILPSGKVVDKSTIDKHSRADDSWGRSASDPFTGVPFTVHSKPILNAALKSQIDQFLLLHQHHPEVKTVPRTVGHVPAAHKRPLHLTHYSSEQVNQRKMPRLESSTSAGSSKSFSLDASIQSALSSMTRFTRIPKAASPQAADNCIVCASTESLYQLRVCGHLICRKCMLGARTTCSCGAGYTRTDVVRYFKKTIM